MSPGWPRQPARWSSAGGSGASQSLASVSRASYSQLLFFLKESDEGCFRRVNYTAEQCPLPRLVAGGSRPHPFPRAAGEHSCLFIPALCPSLLQQSPAVPITWRTAVRPEACSVLVSLKLRGHQGSTASLARSLVQPGAEATEQRAPGCVPGGAGGLAARNMLVVAAVPAMAGCRHGLGLRLTSVAAARVLLPPRQFLTPCLWRRRSQTSSCREVPEASLQAG